MLMAHLGSAFLLVLQAVVTFRLAFFLGFWDAIKRLPAILPKRFAEKRLSTVKDRQIRRLFREFKKSTFIVLK
jgi:hypothetical protein